MRDKPVVVSVPFAQPPGPKSPGWFRTFGKQTGTVVEYRGRLWKLVERWSWMDYDGRGWELQ